MPAATKTPAAVMAEATLKGMKTLFAHLIKPIERRAAEQANDLHNAFLRIHAAETEMRRLTDRIEKSATSLRYRGVFKDGARYEVGEFVTHGGSLWHCDLSSEGAKPGGYGFTLAVKGGQR